MPDTEFARELFVFSNAAAAAKTGPEEQPEVRVIERLLAGERDAFGELYRMFAPVVHGIVLVRVPYSEVPDIVQEVFVLAYENLHSLRDRRAFAGWLARIARNRAAEFHRSKKPSEELPEELTSHATPTAEALEILDAIRSLPQSYRETLVLRLVEGMTGIEIAERTGMSHESVRVNLHRGMELLRKNLGVERKKRK